MAYGNQLCPSEAVNKCRGEEILDAKPLRDLNASCGQVHGLSDDREVEAVGGADVAVKHSTIMEAESVLERCLPSVCPDAVKCSKAPAYRQDTLERLRRRATRQYREERQDRIADELQDVTANTR